MVSGQLRRPDRNTPYLVGRDGVEPSQSQTGDLQSLGLATCSASPFNTKPSFNLIFVLYPQCGQVMVGDRN